MAVRVPRLSGSVVSAQGGPAYLLVTRNFMLYIGTSERRTRLATPETPVLALPSPADVPTDMRALAEALDDMLGKGSLCGPLRLPSRR